MDAISQRLNKLLEQFQQGQHYHLGYPINLSFDYTTLYPFLNYALNNAGDPFINREQFLLNTHEFEREVVEFFSYLTHAEPENSWGYITNGGSEGNLYALYLARQLFPNAIAYYSEEAHYSIRKKLAILNMPGCCLKSLPNGDMDYDDLFQKLAANPNSAPIIIVNIGSTMKGAIDDIQKIKDKLAALSIKHYYLHADAALSGMILPFLDNPPPFGFDVGIDSIAISGHKMIGSPIPCGIVLTKKEHVARVSKQVDYIDSLDSTISGSRNAITPLFLWYAIKTKGIAGFKKEVEYCLDLAQYTCQQFNEYQISAWRNLNSITVVFPVRAEHDKVLKKWHIPSQAGLAHLVTMPNVTRQQIDEFIRAFLCT